MAAGYNGDRADVSAEAGTNPTPEIPPSRGGDGYIDPKYSTIKVNRSAPV
jgi:hypothetical protein